MKKFLKGMYKDSERVDQPEGTYRDALNANINDVKGAITNEQGTKLIGTNAQVVGEIALDDGEILIFQIDPDTEQNFIRLVDPETDTDLPLYTNPGLNFSVQHPIEGVFRKLSNGDRVAYFTDNTYTEEETEAYTYVSNNNPPRAFNIDKQKRAVEENIFNIVVLYGDSSLTVDKLDLFPNPGIIPRIDGVEVLEGGGLSTAAYHLALAYVDENLNETNYFVISNPVSIVRAPEYTFPIEAQTGNQRATQTKKSIAWKVRVYENCNYRYIQPAIIRVEGGAEGIESQEVYKLEPILHPKEDTILDIVHTGLENFSTASLDDVIIDNPRYLSAKTIAQSRNRLYLANLKQRPDIGYQKFANAIEVDAVTEEVEDFDPRVFSTYSLNVGYYLMIRPDAFVSFLDNGGFNEDYVTKVIKPIQENSDRGYRNANTIFKKKSYRRNEVYAFYISFILNDGTETLAYHIPGRAPVNIDRLNLHPFNTINETDLIENISDAGQYFGIQTEEILGSIPDAKVYQMFDTTILSTETPQSMSYWENENETYPDLDDFDIWSVDPDGNPIDTGETLRFKKVRHHKFPSNSNFGFAHVKPFEQFSIPNNYEESDETGKVVLNETVRYLGLRLKNIRIPKDILSQVQEYRIYFAKRKEEDKTIVGSGVPAPGHPRYSTQLTTSQSAATKLKNYTAFYMKGEFASPINGNSVMQIQNPGWVNTAGYYGSPVFKIHDFSMLRQEKNISNITHIDVQYILTCRHFRGGPHSFLDVNDITTDVGYNSLGWISEQLGNNSDPNDDDVAVRAWTTSAMIANVYSYPNASLIDVGAKLGNGQFIKVQDLFQTGNNILMIDEESKAYLPGRRNLRDEKGSSFKGANYLLNSLGETAVALGLRSGLPALSGFHPSGDGESLFDAGFDNTFGDVALAWHAKGQGYLNVYHQNGGLDDSANYVLTDNKAYRHGKPNVYLVNMCSRKSNVFKPFDRQELVWTGYSEKILDPDLDTGIVDIDNTRYEIEEIVGEGGFRNYYLGTQSRKVFGGDTFISRFSVRTTSMEYGWTFFGNNQSIPFDLVEGSPTQGETSGIEISALPNSALTDTAFRSNQNHTPVSTLISYICESDENINFRHPFDVNKGVDINEGKFFDLYTAASIIFEPPSVDFTSRDNLLYESHYSALQDIKVPQPFPKRDVLRNLYPTRIIRSQNTNNEIVDRYREFLTLDLRDLPEDSGEIWKITEIKNLIYIQTEENMYLTKGNERMTIDTSNVFVGSGDIFELPPDKLVAADVGVAGTVSQFASVRVPEGLFFVSYLERKVYLLGQGLETVSDLGMEDWFLENIPFEIEQYGASIFDVYTNVNMDAPTQFFGFVAGYDPKMKKIVLTKRERIPNQDFIDLYNAGSIEFNTTTGTFFEVSQFDTKEIPYDSVIYFEEGGWTVSYSPKFKVWASRHSYIPRMYTTTYKYLYSYNLESIWEHSDFDNPGNFYGTIYPFEFEYIDNTSPAESKIFSSIYFWLEVTQIESHTTLNEKFTDTGFESFYVYNSRQISGTPAEINYLSNTRLVDKIWYINEFRDFANIQGSNTSSLINVSPNVQDEFTTEVFIPSEDQRMFIEEGVVNPNYLDLNKPWHEQKRFVDTYLAVRLSSSNTLRRLINLFGAGTKFRKSFR